MILTVVKKGAEKKGVFLNNPKAVYTTMRFIANKDREHFYVLHCDVKNQLIAKELISVGTLTSSQAHPREVFKGAILNNSAGIICVHNHPSGNLTPSKDDMEITHKLRKSGELLGIPLLDHIIISGRDFLSVNDCCKGEEPLHDETKRTERDEREMSALEILDELDMDLSFSMNVVEMIAALEEATSSTKYEWVLFEMRRKLAHIEELFEMMKTKEERVPTL